MLGRQIGVVFLVAAVCAETSPASIGLISAPFDRPALRVDAAGNAEVSWFTGGTRRAVLIPPTGELAPGTLPGPDVSVAAPGIVLPYRKAIRRTPDGRYWALQAWQTAFKGPIELRFARWQGAPTEITLAFKNRGRYVLLTGKATFHGRPVAGTYRTNGGALISLAAALDCFGCPAAKGNRWFRFNGVKTAPDGSFGSGLKQAWMGARFRASIVGPNIGSTLAPDAATTLRAG